jgi:protein MpaA
VLLGHSLRGRRITALEYGDPDAGRRLVVVGVIHGSEPAGIRIVRALERRRPPADALLWLVPDLNPDGVAAGTRQNAHGVDLNRNFPWRWQPLGPRGALEYSGAHALSEPESRLMRRLILTVRPAVSVYFHQPLGLVDESGGSRRIERRFARVIGLPLRRLRRYPGSAVGWQNHRLTTSTAFVVELPPGRPPGHLVRRGAAAVLALARP